MCIILPQPVILYSCLVASIKKTVLFVPGRLEHMFCLGDVEGGKKAPPLPCLYVSVIYLK